MARYDFKVLTRGGEEVITYKALVASGTTLAIKAGEPSLVSGATGARAGVVKAAADADPTTADNHAFAGLAKDDSTETTTAAGEVRLVTPMPGILYSGKAKSSTAANTQAKIDALVAKRVIFDLTSTTWTVDTAATDAAANGIVIVGGEYASNTVWFMISPGVTIFNSQN
jgi:hypothetical protein